MQNICSMIFCKTIYEIYLLYSFLIQQWQFSSVVQVKNAEKIAERPTRIYIILVAILISPNKNETKSNLKAPTNPQFNAPIITSVRALYFKNFIIILLLIFC